MLFSIVVPVHNAENNIEKCVKSLMEQDVETQIILVENDSGDNTLSILKKLENENDNVEVYISEKKGVSAARNMGLTHVRGDYIGFCDADDFYEENILGQVYKIFSEKRADIVITALNRIEGENTSLVVSKEEKTLGNSEAVDFVMCNPCITGSVWNKFFNKELINYISFPENLTHLEDGYMNVQLLTRTKNLAIYVSKICTYNYVVNEDSATGKLERCFNEKGESKFNISMHCMLNDLPLNKQERESIRDQIYNLSTEFYYGGGNQLSDDSKKQLYEEIKNNWVIFMRRVFRYDALRRIKCLIKGLLIITTVVRR